MIFDPHIPVREVICKFIKATLSDADMYESEDRVPVAQLQQIIRDAVAAGDESARGLGDISWTPSMRRLYALLAQVCAS